MEQRREKRKKKKKTRMRKTILVMSGLVIAAAAFMVYYHTTQFSLKLKGESEMTIGLWGVYEEPGVQAVIEGRDASDQVKIKGSVDVSKPGTYKLTYTAGNLKKTRTVTVTDKMNPEIVLSGEQNVEMKLGDAFEEPGYTAKDEKGNDITDSVKVSEADFNKAGENRISYTAEDKDGNKTRVYRTVNVMPNKNLKTPGLPICMYHYVYDENNPPNDLNKRYGNYISAQDLEEELNWLNDEGYYYPTWKEVRDYVAGRLILPEKSIVICFDDGALSFLENGIPVLEKCQVPATCFMITSSDGENKIKKYKSEYVYYESHSHNMHRPGGNIGHGGIFTVIPEQEGIDDLEKSVEICGSHDAFAYPYGDFNERSRDMVEKAGFLCAVTTQYGKAKPGQDPLLLPRVRMSMGQSMQTFKSKVSP